MLTGAEIQARFPQWTVGDDVIGLFVPEGGFVDAALANSTHVQLARGYGATVLEECPVRKVQPTSDGHAIVSDIVPSKLRHQEISICVRLLTMRLT